ncbi:MAG: NUDIX hydrolase [Patescibacteria group bacterium]
MVKKWQKLGSRIVYEDRWVKIRSDQMKMSRDQVQDWTVIEEGEGAAIGALTDDNKLILIKENRVGAGEIMWHLPAGYFDPEVESKEESARRELREETGYEAGEIINLANLHRAPSRYTQIMSYYLARDLRLTKQSLEPDEDIEVALIDFREVLNMIDRGEITDVETVVVVLLIDRYVRNENN